MAGTTDRELEITPDCPSCGMGNTHPKAKLNKDYTHTEANAFCKNCFVEFYVPPLWFNQDDWRDDLKTFPH